MQEHVGKPRKSQQILGERDAPYRPANVSPADLLCGGEVALRLRCRDVVPSERRSTCSLGRSLAARLDFPFRAGAARSLAADRSSARSSSLVAWRCARGGPAPRPPRLSLGPPRLSLVPPTALAPRLRLAHPSKAEAAQARKQERAEAATGQTSKEQN